jgi:hypothetical protein
MSQAGFKVAISALEPSENFMRFRVLGQRDWIRVFCFQHDVIITL